MHRLQIYVTLKILKADVSSNSGELRVLNHLLRTKALHPGRDHVVQLLDHFQHQGPNGLHSCLVFSVMLSDGDAMTIQEKPHYSGYVRMVSRQILLGLDYLHNQGLMHGGMRFGSPAFNVYEY